MLINQKLKATQKSPTRSPKKVIKALPLDIHGSPNNRKAGISIEGMNIMEKFDGQTKTLNIAVGIEEKKKKVKMSKQEIIN